MRVCLYLKEGEGRERREIMNDNELQMRKGFSCNANVRLEAFNKDQRLSK